MNGCEAEIRQEWRKRDGGSVQVIKESEQRGAEAETVDSEREVSELKKNSLLDFLMRNDGENCVILGDGVV